MSRFDLRRSGMWFLRTVSRVLKYLIFAIPRMNGVPFVKAPFCVYLV